jgi:hypothetical protein
VGNSRTGPGGATGGAAIDVTSRSKEALAIILNNTIAFNQAGILLREDGLDPQGRTVALVQNNTITTNTTTGLSTASALAKPNVFHNNAWGNPTAPPSSINSSNFGGTLANIPPSAFDLLGNPIPDRVCTPTTAVCGNISVNPLFVNPVDPRSVSDRADFFRLANFELQSTSKLIDRGQDKGAAVRDFKGRTRTIDVPDVGNNTSPPPPPAPDSDPRSVDIGAFEFVPSGVLSAVGQRTSARSRAISAATDDILDELGSQVAGRAASHYESTHVTSERHKRQRSLIDEWLVWDWTE